MKPQHAILQSRTPELSISSKQQPDKPPFARPATVEAGLAAVVLTALGFALVLAYAAASAAIARNGYAEMHLRQEVEELRARNALLRYQNHLAASSERVCRTAKQLNLEMADPVAQVDYILLPSSTPAQVTRVALAPRGERTTLSSLLSELAAEVGVGGRAEASTDAGHRP